MKYCLKCHLPKDEFEFYHYASARDGYHKYCKTCSIAYATKSRLLRRYGLTEEDLARILESQGGVCAICKEPAKLSVDHDHQTKKVRGLLCPRCNFALGHFRDSPELLQSAISYLKSSVSKCC